MHPRLSLAPLALGTALVGTRSLDGTNLTNNGKYMSGILKLIEALPHSQLTSLRSAKTALELWLDFAPSTVTSP